LFRFNNYLLDAVDVSSDNAIVPYGCELLDSDFAYNSRVGSNPALFNLGLKIIKRQDSSVFGLFVRHGQLGRKDPLGLSYQLP